MNLSNTNLATSILVVIGFLFLLLLPLDLVFSTLGLSEFKEERLGDILKNVIIIVYGYLLIRQFGYTKVSGVFNIRPQHHLLLMVPIYFIGLGFLQYTLFDYEFSDITGTDVLILLGSMLTVGLSEEIIFRGFVLPNLIKGSSLDQPLFIPIFLASFLFGILHFLNLFQSDTSFPVVLAQVTYATMFGISFGIVLLRSGSLLPLALLHGLINFSFNWGKLPGAVVPPEIETYQLYDAIISVIIVLPYFYYTLKELPKLNRDAILNLYPSNP